MIIKHNAEVQQKLDLIHGYFLVQELVSERVYILCGDMSIALIPLEELITVVTLRKELDRAMYINTWCFPKMKRFDGRGYRDLLEETGSLGSQHRIAKGWDYDVVGMTAQEVRDFIIENQNKFPHIRRLEDGVSWTHHDSKCTNKNEIDLF
jgi:hypothetical protein